MNADHHTFGVSKDSYAKVNLQKIEIKNRAFNTIAMIVFSIIFFYSYKNYVSVEWGYTGLIFQEQPLLERVIVLIAIIAQAWIMPQVLNRPSSVVIWMFTVLIFVPTMIITTMIGEHDRTSYYNGMLALTISLYFISLLFYKNRQIEFCELPSALFFNICLLLFLFISTVLVLFYGSILAFSDISEVYDQRTLASDFGSFGFVGYIRLHYLYILSSVLYCSGLLQKKYLLFSILGFFGYVLTYLIDASKIAFIIPMLITGVWYVTKYWGERVWVLTAGLAMIVGLSSQLVSVSAPAKLFADLLLVRSISIPAQTFAQYSDVFGANGFTWWSNIRGISLFVDAPRAFAADPLWPSLGRIVGAHYFGLENGVNLNSNPFVGEGVAAAGAPGILIISFFLVAWLKLFDSMAKSNNTLFVVIMAVPLGMALSNAHLSTVFVSFGGGLWLIVLYFLKRDARSVS